MPLIFELESKIREMIDELKGLCSQNGLSNQASEERIITSVFLYKFLNDKFMYNLKKWAEEIGSTVDEILADEDMVTAFNMSHEMDVTFDYKDTISELMKGVMKDDFFKKFDDALLDISEKNKRFSIATADGGYKPLFEAVTDVVQDSKRNAFAKSIFSIICQNRFDFTDAYENSFDFYSSIFEYLIKDYNVASGTYAEYYTPQSVSSIIAKILVGMSDKIEASEICDPAAGSGSLVLHLAHELGQDDGLNRAIVYTQDISAKSSRFLRLNLLLNGMTESLPYVIEGDTLLDPAHFKVKGQPTSGLKTFDYMVSNPPFKLDFSSTRNAIENKWSETDRFFAGVPKIPANKKESMAIYLLFIQHILYCLKDGGKAAVVVPTGFLTAKSAIERKIREKLIEKQWLKGVVSMPSNIFANTGTNVSVIFIDKANQGGDVILVDASKLGEKVKDGKNQRTLLSDVETKLIENTFIAHQNVDDFAVVVSYEDIKEKGYSFSAGQYFEVKIEHIDITEEEFNANMAARKERLTALFSKGHKLENNILDHFSGVSFNED